MAEALNASDKVAEAFDQRLISAGLEAQYIETERRTLSLTIAALLKLGRAEEAFSLAQSYIRIGARSARSQAEWQRNVPRRAASNLNA